MGYSSELKSMGAIGYKHMIGYLSNLYSKEEMITLLSRDTRRYAKRQLTWFSKNKDLRWMNVSEKDEIRRSVYNWLGDVNRSGVMR